MTETAIKREMDRRGFTPLRVAEIIGVSRQAVECWSKGEYRPDTDKARLLMPLLGLTWDEIYPPKKAVND